MAEMLLINPRSRRRAKPAKRRASPRRARRASPRRRRNPINNLRSRAPIRVSRRRANPLGRVRRRMSVRRRRNPISLGGGAKSMMTMLKDALIGGAGAVGVDMLYGKLAPMLPASLQVTPGAVGAGDAIKAVITVMAGKLLSKPTRGLSVKMAQGALTVQAHGIVSGLLPASMRVNGLAYYSPAMIANMTNRVGPIRKGMNAYVQPGRTQLLNGVGVYTNRSQLLNRSPAAREGFTIR